MRELLLLDTVPVMFWRSFIPQLRRPDGSPPSTEDADSTCLTCGGTGRWQTCVGDVFDVVVDAAPCPDCVAVVPDDD